MIQTIKNAANTYHNLLCLMSFLIYSYLASLIYRTAICSHLFFLANHNHTNVVISSTLCAVKIFKNLFFFSFNFVFYININLSSQHHSSLLSCRIYEQNFLFLWGCVANSYYRRSKCTSI